MKTMDARWRALSARLTGKMEAEINRVETDR